MPLALLLYVEWRSERCWIAEFGEVTPTRPDGLGVWEEDGVRVQFFLKHDRSMEPLEGLAAKMPGYEELERALGCRRWVLFSFASPRLASPRLASPRREAGARAALAGRRALVANLVGRRRTAAARGDLGAARSQRAAVCARRSRQVTERPSSPETEIESIIAYERTCTAL
jgi:hypothetical protein